MGWSFRRREAAGQIGDDHVEGALIVAGFYRNGVAHVHDTDIVVPAIPNWMLSNMTTLCPINSVLNPTRPIAWIQAAKRAFDAFPEDSKAMVFSALNIAADGGMALIAKPMNGLGSGVFEIALPFQGNAFRVVYAVQLADELWVVHALQKKSTQGIKTPKHEIDLIKDRLKRLKEMLK